MQTKQSFEVKVKASDEDKGTFTAYASTFHRDPDSYGDIVRPGAFKSSLEKWEQGKVIPVLWSHEAHDPFSDIGTVINAVEDDHGLLVTGQLDLDNPTARQVFRLVKGGRINRMSFGFTITDSAMVKLDDGKSVRELRDIDLNEVSLVRYPANDHAEVIAVKSADPVEAEYLDAKAQWDAWERAATADDDRVWTVEEMHAWDEDRTRFCKAERAWKEKQGINLPRPVFTAQQPNQKAAPATTPPAPKLERKQIPMNLQNQLKAAVQTEYEANERLEKEHTATNLKAAHEAAEKVRTIEQRIATAKAANAALDSLSDDEGVECGDGPNGAFRIHPSGQAHDRRGDLSGTSRASKGEPFARAVKTALASKGVGESELGNVASLSVPYGDVIIRDPEKKFSLENLVNRRIVDTGSGQYLAQTLRDNQATSVPRGQLKPTSKYGMEARNWELATLAHLSEPIARQWLEDMRNVSQWLSTELAYGLSEAVDSFILNGGTSENGNQITGLLNTPGIETVAYKVDPLRSIRRAIGDLDTAGIGANGIAMNPLDWEEVETLADSDGRTLLAPTGQSAARQLWGVTVTLSAGIPQGQAIAADWSSIVLLNRGIVSMTVAEYGALLDDTGQWAGDLFSRNQLAFRCEQRIGLTLLSLPSIRKVELAEA